MNIGQSANKLAKGFTSSVQATRERLGQVAQEDITELPQGNLGSFVPVAFHSPCIPEYKDLEARVDALRVAHLSLLKYVHPLPLLSYLTRLYRITKAYESESYDYPVQIQESITEFSTTIGHGITNFAATNLKGTNLPVPSPTASPTPQQKTLPHALCRASTTAAHALKSAPGGSNDKLGTALAVYAAAMDKVAVARTEHDESIQTQYLHPWQTTLSTTINVAMKARQAVRISRLELDAAKQVSVGPTCASVPEILIQVISLKNAAPSKQEHARLDVENAEDDLVQKTEVAITLMKTVLDNVSLPPLCQFIALQIQLARASEELERTDQSSGKCFFWFVAQFPNVTVSARLLCHGCRVALNRARRNRRVECRRRRPI